MSSDDESSEEEKIEPVVVDPSATNFIRVPWEGEPPKIVIPKSKQKIIKSPFEGESTTDRKIWFCRDRNKRGKTLKVWGLPLNWNEKDVETAFAVFGKIEKVHFMHPKDIIHRYCNVQFDNKSMVEFAMKYDSSSIVQPILKGSIPFGIKKYLTEYIQSRPSNVNHLENTVQKFMDKFDGIEKKKEIKLKQTPRRNRGWIQKREKDGFTSVHYVNKHERSKHKAVRMEKVDKTETSTDIPNDIHNAPPHKTMYDKKRNRAYNELNNIDNVYKRKKEKLEKYKKRKREKIREAVIEKNKEKSIKRMGLNTVKLVSMMEKRKRWDKDKAKTTQLRRGRTFKPL